MNLIHWLRVLCLKHGVYTLLLLVILTNSSFATNKSTVLKKFKHVTTEEPKLMNVTKALLKDATVSEEVLSQLNEVLDNLSRDSELYVRSIVLEGIKKGHITVENNTLKTKLNQASKTVFENSGINAESRANALTILKEIKSLAGKHPIESNEILAVYAFAEKLRTTKQGGALETVTASLAKRILRLRKSENEEVLRLVGEFSKGGDLDHSQDFYVTEAEADRAKRALHRTSKEPSPRSNDVALKELRSSKYDDMNIAAKFLALLPSNERNEILTEYMKGTTSSHEYLNPDNHPVPQFEELVSRSDEQVKNLVIQRLIDDHIQTSDRVTYQPGSKTEKSLLKLFGGNVRGNLIKGDLAGTKLEMNLIQKGIGKAIRHQALSREEILAALYTQKTVKSLKSGMTALSTLSSFLGHLMKSRAGLELSREVNDLVRDAGDSAGLSDSVPWYRGNYDLLDSKTVSWRQPCLNTLGRVATHSSAHESY